MTTHTTHEHGMFSWTDLSTTNVESAKKFYTTLFGWTVTDMPAPGMTYSMANLGEHTAAAITTLGDDQKKMGAPPAWNAYFTVTDVDAATKKAASAGGKVFKEPFDVMDAGRMSVVQDPTGAVFCLWQGKKHIGAGVTGEPGAITWTELMTNNVDAAGKFYSTVFGWTAEAMQMGPGMTYTVFKAGGKNAAGMMPLSADMKNVPPNWLCYFSVANCDATVKKAGELGGKTIVPPHDIPNVGRYAVLMDGQGAAFGILQPPK